MPPSVTLTTNAPVTAIEKTTEKTTALTIHVFPPPASFQEDMLISHLTQYLKETYQGHTKSPECFNGNGLPPIPLSQYIRRWITEANRYAYEPPGIQSIGVICACMAVEYIHRVGWIVTEYNSHRCFLAAYLIAFKYLYDFGIDAKSSSMIGGVSTTHLFLLELEFCVALKWRCGVESDLFQKYNLM